MAKSGFTSLFTLREIPLLFASLVAFTLPFQYRITTILLILFCFSLLITGIIYGIRPGRKIIYAFIPWLGFYLAFAASFFYSSDKSASIADLETKFSLLILPLLMGSFFETDLRKLSIIIKSFIGGVCIFLTVSILYAVYNYLRDSDTSIFFYHNLVALSDMNAVYHSWYVLTAIVLLLFSGVRFNRFIRMFSFTILVAFLILLSGRTMQILFALVIVPAFLWHLYRNSKFSKPKIYGAAVSYIAALLLFLVNPVILNNRFSEFSNEKLSLAFLHHYDHYDYEFGNLNNRLFFWRVGWENFASGNILFGAGNGDVSHLQNNRMHELGINDIYNEENRSTFYNVNLHNMYLQTALATGLTGLVFLLWMLFSPFFVVLKRKMFRQVYYLFHFVAILFMIQESVFQTQAGVVFYSFFSVLFLKFLVGKELQSSSDRNAKIESREFQVFEEVM